MCGGLRYKVREEALVRQLKVAHVVGIVFGACVLHVAAIHILLQLSIHSCSYQCTAASMWSHLP